MDDAVTLSLIVFFAFLLAGFVKGVIGMGLPTVAIGLMGLVLAPAQAAAILIVPSFFTNVWQAAAGPRLGVLLRRMATMLVGICAGTLAGTELLTAADSRATAALGIALVIYAAVGLSPLKLAVPARIEWWLAPLVGLATGVASAATGIFAIPAIFYLQSLGLERDDLVQALGISFTVSTVALAAALALAGAMPHGLAGLSAAALVPALAGMAIGQRVRGRISPRLFRLCFFVGILVLGAHLALRAML